MTFLESGSCEGVKGAFHATLGLLALGAFGYNVLAFVQRRDAHLALNTVLYGAIVAIEVTKVQHHRQACG